jgi:DNA gyrase/topoisomerase IV subunit A
VLQRYGLSQEQADAILALRLGRLTAAEETKLKKEHEELSEQVTLISVTVAQCNYQFQISACHVACTFYVRHNLFLHARTATVLYART